MSEHFLTEIEIKNFKCFEQFKTEGFGRVNLISGKNNVGKTALMEACYINVHTKDVNSFFTSLAGIKIKREKLNIFYKSVTESSKKIIKTYLPEFLEKTNEIISSSNKNIVSYKIKEEQGIKSYMFSINEKNIMINIKDFSFQMNGMEHILFIDNFGFGYAQTIGNFSSIQKKDDEKFLDKILNNFDSSIETFKIIDEKPQCKKDGEYLEITELGDGVRHIISMVTALYKTENGYLFIDEIDNGIYYQQLDNLWEFILKFSKQLNVQVFATTHSKECIDAYYRAAKKLQEQDISYILMKQLKDGEIKARVYDYEALDNSMEQAHEVRGL